MTHVDSASACTLDAEAFWGLRYYTKLDCSEEETRKTKVGEPVVNKLPSMKGSNK
jgi:hypothetical protein